MVINPEKAQNPVKRKNWFIFGFGERFTGILTKLKPEATVRNFPGASSQTRPNKNISAPTGFQFVPIGLKSYGHRNVFAPTGLMRSRAPIKKEGSSRHPLSRVL
jgi:hypothetical protein